MVIWRAGDGDDAHDQFSKAIFKSLEEALAKFDDQDFGIALIRTRFARSHDYRDVVVELTLPGNVHMTVDCWSGPEGELDFEGPSGFDENVSEVVETVMDFLASCQWHGFSRIANFAKDMRLDAQSFSTRMLGANQPCFELLDLRLQFTDFWRHTLELVIEVEYSSLDEWLRPTTFSVESFSLDQARKDFHENCSKFSKRAAARERLSKHGATAEIDLLAINLLKRGGDLHARLERLQDERPWAGDVGVDCGHVFARAPVHGRPHIVIRGDQIRLYSCELPEIALMNAINKPITDIIDCPLFSPEMTILSAYNDRSSSDKCVLFGIKQPRLLYCNSSGHYWMQEAALMEGQQSAGDSTSS